MASKGQLLRVLGVGFGVAVSLGGTVGAGILRTPGMVAAQLRSVPLIILLWVAGGICALICTICVCELATMLPYEGGWYVYARRAFGSYGGFFAGYSDWLVQVVALAYVGMAAGDVTAKLLPAFSLGVKPNSILIIALLGLLHYLGIRTGSRAQQLNSLRCRAWPHGLCGGLLQLPAIEMPSPVCRRAPRRSCNRITLTRGAGDRLPSHRSSRL